MTIIVFYFHLSVAEENITHPSKTAIKFCPGAPILVTGDIAGDTKVYRIHGILLFYSLGYEDQDPNM